ncbi:MAG: hypothetical protein AAGA66_09075 [Bacteroidota bacterium]
MRGLHVDKDGRLNFIHLEDDLELTNDLPYFEDAVFEVIKEDRFFPYYKYLFSE